MRRLIAAAALVLAAVFGFATPSSTVNAAGVATSAVTQTGAQSAQLAEQVRYRHRRHYGPRVYFSYGGPRYRYYGRKRHYRPYRAYRPYRSYRPYYRKHRHYGHHRRYRRH